MCAMTYHIFLLLSILVTVQDQSYIADSFERRTLAILETSVSDGSYESINGDNSVRLLMSGQRLTVRPFYLSDFNSGLFLQPESDATFKVIKLQMNFSPVSIEDAIREEPKKRG